MSAIEEICDPNSLDDLLDYLPGKEPAGRSHVEVGDPFDTDLLCVGLRQRWDHEARGYAPDSIAVVVTPCAPVR
jgi:hypothetical protein